MAAYHNSIGAVVLLTDAQGRIAMQLRDDKPGLPAANKWGLFGGLVDHNEWPRETALREIQEELSVSLDVGRLSLYRDHYIPEQNLTTHIFHYPVTDELDQAVLREGQAWDFIAKDDSRVAQIGLHHHDIVLEFWANESQSFMIEIGDCVVLNGFPDNLIGLNEEALRVFRFCVSRVYPVKDIDRDGQFWLDVSADIDGRFDDSICNTIGVERCYITKVERD